MENLVTITINGKTAQVPSNYTIMQAADEMGISIPRLCFLKDINENQEIYIQPNIKTSAILHNKAIKKL